MYILVCMRSVYVCVYMMTAWSNYSTVYMIGQLDFSYSLALVHLIPYWLIWAEIMSTVKSRVLTCVTN